jgi:hypothetical protein
MAHFRRLRSPAANAKRKREARSAQQENRGTGNGSQVTTYALQVYRSNASATSPTIENDFAEILSSVSDGR